MNAYHVSIERYPIRYGRKWSFETDNNWLEYGGGATTIEPTGMLRHVREISFLHKPPIDQKKHHVRNARHTWLKVETTSPFLPSPLTNILSADTLALLSPEERLFLSCVETTVFTFSIKCIFRTVVENIWMAGPPGVRSFFTRCPFPS